MIFLLSLIVLVCTAIGALVGHPNAGLIVGAVLAFLFALSAARRSLP